MQRKLLVLDVGAIITGYDDEHQLEDGTSPAIIDRELAGIFKNFYEKMGFFVAIAAGMNSDNLDYFKNEFEKAGINEPHVAVYSPKQHLYDDSNINILKQYTKEFFLGNDKDYIYFFDAAENNVENAKMAGFINSFQVTKENTLVKQLSELLDTLGLRKSASFENETINDSVSPEPKSRKSGSFSSANTMFPGTKPNLDEKKSLVESNENNNTSSCCCNIF